MEKKIIEATFKNNQKEIITYGLWQYDYGQTLRIRGLQLPSTVQVHYALQELDGESVAEIGTTQNGVTDVKIPDSLLKKTQEIDIYDRPVYKMFAWIYLTDGNYGKTEYKIILPIIKRAKPANYDPNEEVVKNVFDQAVAKVTTAADRAEAAAKQAAETAEEIIPIFFGNYKQRDGPYILFEFQDEESTVLLNLKSDTNTAVTAFVDGDMYGVNNIKKDNNDQYMIE